MTAEQLAIIAILDNAHAFQWTVQGFGMLRLYVRRIGRIHIWCDALRYEAVSMVHNHSWDLESRVIFGQIENQRYNIVDDQQPGARLYHERRLVTGMKHEWVEPPKDVWMVPLTREYYGPGQVYGQAGHIIHQTFADDGTVTVVRRNEDERGEAEVYWLHGSEWGTAQPRHATAHDITLAQNAAHRQVSGRAL